MTRHARAVLGPWLLAASLVACSGSSDTNTSKSRLDGGSGGSGAGGGSSAGGAGGGSAGCNIPECFVAVECVETCGGPVVRSSCCPCESGTIDRRSHCSGSGGATGSGGSTATGGKTGSGGVSAGGASAGGASASGGHTSTDGGVDLSKLNTNCQNGACPSGLEAVTYYGIAGPSGPLFCTCTIRCANDPKVCPPTTTCTTIADGPGQVCSK